MSDPYELEQSAKQDDYNERMEGLMDEDEDEVDRAARQEELEDLMDDGEDFLDDDIEDPDGEGDTGNDSATHFQPDE